MAEDKSQRVEPAGESNEAPMNDLQTFLKEADVQSNGKSTKRAETPPPAAPSPAPARDEQRTDPAPRETETTIETPEDPPPEEPRLGRSAEKRIRKLNKKKKDAERLAAERAKENEELRRKLAALQHNAPPPKKPRMSDYRNEEEFAEAFVEHKEAMKRYEDAKAPLPVDPTPKNDVSPFTQEESQDFMARGKAEFGDEVFTRMLTEGEIRASELLQGYMVRSEHGPRLAAYLSKNPEVVAELNEETSPQDLHDEVTEVLMGIERGDRAMPEFAPAHGSEQPPPSPQKPKRRRPPPGPAVGLNAGTDEGDLSKMDMDKFAKIYRQKMRDRGYDL